VCRTGAWHAPVNINKEKVFEGTNGRKQDFSHKPLAFESEIHPSHKSEICTLCISPCREQIYVSVNFCAGYGNGFVNGCLSIHSR